MRKEEWSREKESEREREREGKEHRSQRDASGVDRTRRSTRIAQHAVTIHIKRLSKNKSGAGGKQAKRSLLNKKKNSSNTLSQRCMADLPTARVVGPGARWAQR